MNKTTTIEWVLNSDSMAGYAINLWVGCSKVSPACDSCYAEISRASKCLGVEWGDDKPRYKCNPYKKLTAINNKAAKQGIRIRVFINPDSDIFDTKAQQEWRDEFWAIVEQTPYIDYILVTKRIGNAKRMIPQSWLDNGYPVNVWQLITVCNQAEADRDIPKLLELDCDVRGLSIEPLLSEIDLEKWGCIECGVCNGHPSRCNNCDNNLWLEQLNWLIVGGESGKNARPMHPDWARKIRDQCIDAGVSLFFKQWDGKKRAGNVLDGQVWQQMPEVKL